ncbi:MAG: uracil phosphoribosyltransferase [Gemmatimonadales bacterium]|jgi:uracil phosphoribosyltransferase|nr:MAG: uracil phosphoribosyltransferase [Gemmatimonadales bacterium]
MAASHLTVVSHPLVQHKMALLRDVNTPTREFRQLVGEIATLLAYEATRTLETEPIPVRTPLEMMEGRRIPGDRIVLVPILRAGLGMVDAVAALFPNAGVGHIGLYRNEETLEPVSYYFKIPPLGSDKVYLVLDPMLATGGSASAAIAKLKESGATNLRLISLVAAPAGVDRMKRDHPDVPVYVAALDRQLNEHGYIVPGLGDAGDRLFGTQ